MRADYDLEALDQESVTNYIGDGARKLVERSLEGTGVEVGEALPVYLEHYRRHMTDETAPYPGVAEGLEKLRAAGLKLAVLTNKPGESTREILSHFELSDFFALVIGGGDVEALKPDPGGLRRILNALNLSTHLTWMVGDHRTDLEVASRIGMRSIYAAYGFGRRDADQQPDLTIESFDELVDHALPEGKHDPYGA